MYNFAMPDALADPTGVNLGNLCAVVLRQARRNSPITPRKTSVIGSMRAGLRI